MSEVTQLEKDLQWLIEKQKNLSLYYQTKISQHKLNNGVEDKQDVNIQSECQPKNGTNEKILSDISNLCARFGTDVELFLNELKKSQIWDDMCEQHIQSQLNMTTNVFIPMNAMVVLIATLINNNNK